jgi:hypothetical protein
MAMSDVITSGRVVGCKSSQSAKFRFDILGWMRDEVLIRGLLKGGKPLGEIARLSIGVIGSFIEAITRDERGIEMCNSNLHFLPCVERAAKRFEENFWRSVSPSGERRDIPRVGHG